MLDPNDRLVDMLTKLKLTLVRDQLDTLLAEAARRDLTLAEALAMMLERELARRHDRRLEMGVSIAKFPHLRDLAGFDFKAQPSLDAKQIRDLAAGRWIASGDTVLLLGPVLAKPS